MENMKINQYIKILYYDNLKMGDFIRQFSVKKIMILPILTE
jgi:hypothetical protein